MLELEKVLSYNRGVAGYFQAILSYLGILYFLNFYPSIISGYLLYHFPFYLQISGMIIIYIVILGLPLWLIYRFRKNKIKTVRNATYMLHYLKDKAYREKMIEVNKINNSQNKWWNKKIIFTKISPFHNLGKKMIFLYAFILLFFGGFIALFYMTFDVPLNYLPTLRKEILALEFDSTKIIKTKYQFVDKIAPLEKQSIMNKCDNYYCDYFGDYLLDENLALVDLSSYFEDKEEFREIITYQDNVVVVKYYNENTSNFEFKVIDLESGNILYVIDDDFMGLDILFCYFTDGFIKNGDLYLIGTEHRMNDDKVAALYQINETGIVNSYYSNEGLVFYKIGYKDNTIYLLELSKENTSNTIIKELDFSFRVVQEKTFNEMIFNNLYNVDGNIIIEGGISIYNYYLLKDDLKLEPKFSSILSSMIISDFDDRLIYGPTLPAYTEVDNNFLTVTNGLDCRECSDDEYFESYYFIKTSDKVYAVNENYTLVFAMTDNYNYSLSRSSLTSFGFCFYLAVFIIPITTSFIVLSKRDKEYIEVKQHLDNITK